MSVELQKTANPLVEVVSDKVNPMLGISLDEVPEVPKTFDVLNFFSASFILSAIFTFFWSVRQRINRMAREVHTFRKLKLNGKDVSMVRAIGTVFLYGKASTDLLAAEKDWAIEKPDHVSVFYF